MATGVQAQSSGSSTRFNNLYRCELSRFSSPGANHWFVKTTNVRSLPGRIVMHKPARFGTTRVFSALAIALLLAISIPWVTLASTDISPGQSAIVSDTGGDPINLRAKPNTASTVLTTV